VSFGGRRILVVEDEVLASLATIDLLEGLGCVIVGPAVRVAAALQLAQTESLDAAILDIDIAGEMVWPVAEELQRRNVPLIVLSACRQWRRVPVLFAAAPHFEKPLEQDRLLRHLGVIWAA
jgi:DNA-binding response OmpR family regulator